jgi:hypothetical protein
MSSYEQPRLVILDAHAEIRPADFGQQEGRNQVLDDVLVRGVGRLEAVHHVVQEGCLGVGFDHLRDSTGSHIVRCVAMHGLALAQNTTNRGIITMPPFMLGSK